MEGWKGGRVEGWKGGGRADRSGRTQVGLTVMRRFLRHADRVRRPTDGKATFPGSVYATVGKVHGISGTGH
jgi:hypothetical protein